MSIPISITMPARMQGAGHARSRRRLRFIPRVMPPGWRGLAAAVVVLSLAAVSAHAATIRVVMDRVSFQPSEVNAKVGDTIEWVNNDILAHTATARNRDWDVAIAAGKTVKLVLKKAGTVEYYCRYHPNMKGTMTVAP